MANEAAITSNLFILKGNLSYQSLPLNFRGNVSGTKGPVPGAMAISTSGTSISFAELTTAGYCAVTNLSSTNYVEYGAWTGTTFYPIGEILPGESYTIRLSRNVGTTLRFRANTAPVNVKIEAFES